MARERSRSATSDDVIQYEDVTAQSTSEDLLNQNEETARPSAVSALEFGRLWDAAVLETGSAAAPIACASQTPSEDPTLSEKAPHARSCNCGSCHYGPSLGYPSTRAEWVTATEVKLSTAPVVAPKLSRPRKTIANLCRARWSLRWCPGAPMRGNRGGLEGRLVGGG